MRNTRVVRMFLMMILFSSLGFATAVAVAVCDKSEGDYYDWPPSLVTSLAGHLQRNFFCRYSVTPVDLFLGTTLLPSHFHYDLTFILTFNHFGDSVIPMHFSKFLNF
jgi:hypothetical protein